MRQILLIGLIGLNVALLLALVFSASRADAQVIGGADYLVLTARAGVNEDALYILNLKTNQLVMLQMNRNTKRMAPVGMADLARDFKGTGGN